MSNLKKEYCIEELAGKVKDPLLSDNYHLLITGIPPEVGGTDVGKTLSLYCQQVNKPGQTIEAVVVALHGHELQFAGRNTTTHDLSVTFVETWDAEITTILEKWARFTRSLNCQTGNLKMDDSKGYGKAMATLHVLQPSGESTKEYEIHNIWPTQVPEIPFQGDSSAIVPLQCTFKYDYYKEADGTT